MAKDYEVLNELTFKTQELHRAIFDKGYEQGFNDGKVDVGATPYGKGLNDAWECARKIGNPDQSFALNVFGDDAYYGTLYNIIEKYSASEAIAKIKEYEEKQKADLEIRVGDEVYIVMENYPSVVTCIFSESGLDNPKAVHITGNGKYAVTPLSQLHKTGRHFDQIAEVLEQLKEAQDETK